MATKTHNTTAPALRAFSIAAEIVFAIALVSGGAILTAAATLV